MTLSGQRDKLLNAKKIQLIPLNFKSHMCFPIQKAPSLPSYLQYLLSEVQFKKIQVVSCAKDRMKYSKYVLLYSSHDLKKQQMIKMDIYCFRSQEHINLCEIFILAVSVCTRSIRSRKLMNYTSNLGDTESATSTEREKSVPR